MRNTVPPSDVYTRAKARWPELEVTAEALASFAGPDADAGLHWEDLYLACACAQNQPRALQAFDASLMPAAATVVSRIDRSGAFADEVCQKLREKLFMAQGQRRPKICEYSGRGSLVSWLRTVALRIALDARQIAVPSSGEDDALADLPAEGDLELDLIKARYRAEFKAAFQSAFATLSSRDRNVMRLNLLDGLNIDQIGSMYSAHRATVARWIALAREKLDEGTRALLADKLRVAPAELDSLVGLVRSQLEVSLTRLLRDGA